MADFERYKIQVDPTLLVEIEARVRGMIEEQDFFADRTEEELDELGFTEYDAPLTPSGEPWSSDLDCVVREVVTMTVALAAQGVRAGRIELLDDNPRLSARAQHPASARTARRAQLRLVRPEDRSTD